MDIRYAGDFQGLDIRYEVDSLSRAEYQARRRLSMARYLVCRRFSQGMDARYAGAFQGLDIRYAGDSQGYHIF
jgi:hypothetical protein